MLFFLIFLVLSLKATVFYASDLQGLPFPYHLSLQYSCKRIRFLPERTFTVLHQGQQLMVGPLLPCQLILFDTGNIVIVAHVDYDTSLLYLFKKVKNIMKNYDSKIKKQKGTEGDQTESSGIPTIDQSHWFKKIIVFTNESPGYYQQFYSEGRKRWTSWFELYNYRSQVKVVEDIVQGIKSYFLINDTVIKASIGSCQFDKDAKYPLASLYLVVRNSPYNFCFINTLCPVRVFFEYHKLNTENNQKNRFDEAINHIMRQRKNINSNLNYPKDRYEDGKQILLEVGRETFFSFNKNDDPSL